MDAAVLPIEMPAYVETLGRCRACKRLDTFLAEVAAEHPGYHCAPVAPFGDPEASLLIVGLAPGMHGANRSGRPFTGDYAGILLYETLHRYGFASRPESVSRDDGLVLQNCLITNAVKCLPPQNKPETVEIRTCNRFLKHELALLDSVRVVLALGLVAHNAVLMSLGLKAGAAKFAHAARHALPDGRVLVDSYHCSRYNTNTGRLTTEAFHRVFDIIRAELAAAS